MTTHEQKTCDRSLMICLGGSIYSDDGDCRDYRFKLMQFTGLLDAKGVEIYEGDIRGGEYNCGSKTQRFLEQMIWSEQGWCFEWRPIIGGEKPSFVPTIIVGNIYTSPELLTK